MSTGTPPYTPPHGRGNGSGGGNGSSGSTATNFQFGSLDAQQLNTGQPRSEVITFGNPFYLNPNEALNQSIGSEVFDGTNYTMWSRSVVMGLKMKHKMGFIDGSIPMPPVNDDKYLLRDGCNTTVLSWILNSLHKDLRRSVMNHVNAKVL
ncbi:unnamed protein product [Linum trigynum]|uniref:Retrotransposon Copia-like N-terminal domain-containing protein n=1 Tax=Linum trigynum TaxID=586398 RepID=A0AAV2CA30_9ROSI